MTNDSNQYQYVVQVTSSWKNGSSATGRTIHVRLGAVDVTGEEFGAIRPAFGPACGSELRDAFDFFGDNRDGKISARELLRGFLAIGDDRCTLEDCKRMIDGVDTDGDGFVCFDDFSRMMERRRR